MPHLFAQFILSGIAGGVLASVLEVLLHASRHNLTSALAAAGLGAILGLALALGACFAAALGARLPKPRSDSQHGRASMWRNPQALVGAAAILGAVATLNSETFSGAWMRERSWAPIANFVAHLLAFLAAFSTLLLVQSAANSRRRPVLLACCAALLACGGAALDAHVLPGLYPGVHASMELAVALSIMAAFWLLWPAPSARVTRAGGALGLAAALGACIALHSDIVLRSHFTAAGPVHAQLLAWLAPKDAPDAWMKQRASAANWLSQRPRRVAADSELGGKLDTLLPTRRRMNLVILSVDTLRADRLAAYGARTSHSPFLDELAVQSFVCERAYTNYPLSSFAYSSMFTGLVPSASPAGLLARGQQPQWNTSQALAEVLLSNGFETAAFSAFNAESIAREESMGHLTHGFGVFTPERRIVAWDGADLVDAACAALPRIAQQRFFLWLHLLDPHAPYKEREGAEGGDNSPEQAYNAEVRYTDQQVRRFVMHLRQLGHANDTIIVIMGDHGEAFGEHGFRFHGTTLYEEQVRVPLLFLVPGLTPRRIPDIASVMDIAPTVMDLLAVADPIERHATSLVPAMLGAGPGPRYAYAELEATQQISSGGRRMVVEGNHKLIVDTTLNTMELYDLAADPTEQTNIAAQMPERRAWLQALMNTITVAPESGGILELEALLAEINDTPAEGLQGPAWRLFGNLHDPVFGINRGFAQAVLGPLKPRVLAAIERCALSSDPNAAIPAMRLAAAIDPVHLWQRMKHAPSLPDLHWQVEITLLRAASGDPQVDAVIAKGLSIEGMPDKQRLAEFALRRRIPIAPELIQSVLRSRCVLECAGVLQALQNYSGVVSMSLLGDLVDHPHWKGYAPVRRAVVNLVAAFPDDSEKAGLLARFARDDDAEIARAATDPLARLVRADLNKWLACADLELRAEDCVIHANLDTAVARLASAVAVCPENTRVQLFLARLEHLLGRTEFSNQRLAALAARGEQLSAEAQRRLAHPLDLGALRDAAIDLKLESFSCESRSVTQAWCSFHFEILNAGTVTLPGGVLPTSLRFGLKLTEPSGRVLDVPNSTEVLIGECDLLGGDARKLYGDFLAPAEPGIYGFALEPRLLLPSGEVRVLPLISVPVRTMTVHSWLPVEDVIPR